jgi:ABC-type sugar transport system ATPase subunit
MSHLPPHTAEVDASENIRMVGIRKEFHGKPVIHGLDLEIVDRELLVVLGPSGSGKSTVLNLLCGLETASAGEIHFGRERVTDIPTERRSISMVFQSNTLYPHKNVRDNILFALKVAQTPANVQAERLRDTTRLLKIDHYLNRRIDQLSGGERQRVAIAKALVKRPKLFLLDEPFAALDAMLRRELRSELVRIHRELATTMLFVTHDQEEALALADRIAVMNKGELVQIGPPLDIYNRPATTWVARFVGSHSINLLDVEVTPEGFLKSPVGRLRPDPAVVAELKRTVAAGAAVLGVRPEHTSVSGQPTPNAVPAEVYSRQNLGSAVLYQLEVQGQLLRAVVPVSEVFDIGDKVYVDFTWSQALWFDPTTQQLVLAGASGAAPLPREEPTVANV